MVVPKSFISLSNNIWIDTNLCERVFHYFKQDDDGQWRAYHGDDSQCEQVEFNLTIEEP